MPPKKKPASAAAAKSVAKKSPAKLSGVEKRGRKVGGKDKGQRVRRTRDELEMGLSLEEVLVDIHQMVLIMVVAEVL